jgi:hypothetical protein
MGTERTGTGFNLRSTRGEVIVKKGGDLYGYRPFFMLSLRVLNS